ncbi:Scytalone dehydratase [Pestalotiopsis sp. NC0098]|nr:Scytalone dehydratase [Pestalotiopsis sp. NC0098]
MATTLSFEELTGCQAALFEWVESYDTKDFERLRKCIAPTLRIDYSSFLNKLWENMDAEQYVPMASDPHFLGNPLLKTQHFVGGVSRWEKTAEDEIVGHHQLRVAHQRYTDATFAEVAVKGHAHGGATMWYRKVDGVWKFAGVCPETRWFEYDYDKVFTDAAAHVQG